jgi:isopentenyl-diphosphate delta-isomerase
VADASNPDDAPKARVVSFNDEPLIVVNPNDTILEYRSKAECHSGVGILHRAFSVFLFDEQGRLLLQQRSADKPLWPLIWSNSCCSHPRRGEEMADAAARRLDEELGVTCELQFVYRFQYHAQYSKRGSENELCSVYLGRVSGDVTPNPNEIADHAWVNVATFEASLAAEPERYSPWLKLEWRDLRGEHADVLTPYTQPV